MYVNLSQLGKDQLIGYFMLKSFVYNQNVRFCFKQLLMNAPPVSALRNLRYYKTTFVILQRLLRAH